MPRFEAVKGLGCSKALRQQLHQLRPLVAVESQLWLVAGEAVQRTWHLLEWRLPWRVTLLYNCENEGVLTEAVVELARHGLKLNETWAARFGEAAVCSAVLRELRIQACGLRGLCLSWCCRLCRSSSYTTTS